MEAELEQFDQLDENFEVNQDLLGGGDVQEIDRLESVGINVSDIKKLKASGFYTMSSIMMSTSTTLGNIKGLSEAKVQKIIECVKKMNTFGFASARMLREKRKTLISISTGSTALDELLVSTLARHHLPIVRTNTYLYALTDISTS